MLSLFDYNDDEMRLSKAPGFEQENSQRWNANNSAVWEDELTYEQFRSRFQEMLDSGNGEPGIFNRRVSNLMLPERRQQYPWLTNPCSEVLLRDMQFCNLSIVVARPDDTFETISEKVRLATIIGTIQSMETNYPGLRPEWKKNNEEERLLGVDINGQFDCPLIQDAETLRYLRAIAVETNRQYAGLLGINQSTAVTCVKPGGNSSQLLNVSSGMHPRYAPFYIRRYRIAATSPLYPVLREAGVPLSPENGQTEESAVTWVASFPLRSPQGVVTRNDLSAIDHCEYWLMVRKNYTEHKPSCSIYYSPEEAEELMQWVWDHRDEVDGISFFPRDLSTLKQLPYEEISELDYHRMMRDFPVLNFALMSLYESVDQTTASSEVACTADSCETV